ncbi:c-type cytochrome [Leisingera sp. S132]|uniref:c-type cytochrome n=1 Tax=Leisingera sp. S132 TaxID=2867016 RepID=UPI0021A970AC|nr:c-type cytochrome [Leisingera sp. S132]UWQ80367.1 c-type cytochrome [Leisingera sp. S132]
MMRWAAFLILTALPAAAQEFTTLKGHGGPVMGIAVSPQGQVATASFDNSAALWTGNSPKWLEAHGAAVTALGFTPAGLITGGDDFAVYLWRAEGPELLGRHKGKVTSVAVSPDGAFAATGSWDGSVRLWPLAGGRPLELSSPGAGVNDLAYGGGALFAATTDGELLRYDPVHPQEPPLPLVKHGFGINQVEAGKGWLAYGAVDGGTRVIDMDSGAQIADFSLDRRPVLSLTHHTETGQLAVGDGHGYIMVLDTAEWQIARDFQATRQGPVWALAFSEDGLMIWAGGLDDVAYGWPIALLDSFDPAMDADRSFLRNSKTMPNGERQFMRKCSICHGLTDAPSRKAGPSLHGVFGRRAGTLPGYRYSPALDGSKIVWNDNTIDALFAEGPDHYIPGSKMPMQVIASSADRADLIEFLKRATEGGSQ